MNNIAMSAFGFSNRFAALASQYPALATGQILSQEKKLYRVISEHGEQLAKIAGRFRFDTYTISY